VKAYVGDGKGRIVLEEDGRIEYENGSFVARVERGGRIYGIEVSRVD
jgi:hypothetical protein